nr:MAG TPA: hypothetical protein [Caudoviricetes sp.]
MLSSCVGALVAHHEGLFRFIKDTRTSIFRERLILKWLSCQ